MKPRAPLELVLPLCAGVLSVLRQADPVGARTAFAVGGLTAVSVCLLQGWFARWRRRVGAGFTRRARLTWMASLPLVALVSAAASWTAAASSSATNAGGLRTAGWLCALVAVWTVLPFVATPGGRALASLAARADIATAEHAVPPGRVRAGDLALPTPTFPAGPRDPRPDLVTLEEYGHAVVAQHGRYRLVSLGDVRRSPRVTREVVRERGWWPLGRRLEVVDASYCLDEFEPSPPGIAAVTVGGLVVGLWAEDGVQACGPAR